MKIIEHRRHAKRTKPSPHLNDEGVRTARRVGDHSGPFARVVTSPKKRAIQTAVAMGFAVDETVSLLEEIPEELNDLAAWNSGFLALHAKRNECASGEKYLRKIRAFFESTLERVPEGGRILIISHGGVVEWSAIACAPEKARNFGNALDTCEGVELHWGDGKFTDAKVLRVETKIRGV